jgi:hypothetical protein
VIVNTAVGPTHVLAVGVTVNTPAVGEVPVLKAVKEASALPVPDAAAPIVVLLFTHANVVPDTSEVKFTAVVDP